jgi:hypothetical protein
MKLTHLKEYNNTQKEFLDIVKYFPNGAQKAVDAVHDRLTICGKTLSDFINDAEDEIIAVAKREGYYDLEPLWVNVSIAHPEDDMDDITVEGEIKPTIDEMSHVYLGYNPQTKHFIMGFDAWLSDDSVDEGIDKLISDSDVQQKYIRQVRQELHKDVTRMVSLAFEFTADESGEIEFGGQMYVPSESSFYSRKGAFKLVKRDAKIIDLRLD